MSDEPHQPRGAETTDPPSLASSAGIDSPAFTQSREFWLALAFAAGLGVLGAFAGLVFLGVIDLGGEWYDDVDPDWFGGELWWVAVTAGAGLVVGVLHRLMRLPQSTPGLIADLKTEHIEAKHVPGIVAVSAASLIGGASLGPEKALGSAIGGAGGWLSERRGLGEDLQKTNTLNGISGAFGGLLSSPLVVVMLVLEVARPGGARAGRALVGGIVASSVSFGIYFAIAGSVFLGVYDVPSYEYETWHLLVGVALGLVAAALVLVLVVTIALVKRVFTRLPMPAIPRAIVGGVVFGLVGVALPLTLFTGTDQLETVIADAGMLGIGLLVVTLFAKMLTFAVSSASGFVGGAIFPTLFIGGTAGVTVHEIFPDIPLGLALTCMLAAVPGGLVSAPFTLTLLTVLLTQVGALQTAPILIAVVTGFLALQGLKYVVTQRKQSTAPPQPAPDSS
jgi:H+/Cl- antiporter ClcA